jgi:hypothetical protein
MEHFTFAVRHATQWTNFRSFFGKGTFLVPAGLGFADTAFVVRVWPFGKFEPAHSSHSVFLFSPMIRLQAVQRRTGFQMSTHSSPLSSQLSQGKDV